MAQTADYTVENHGTIFLFQPQNDAARLNLEENIAEGQWFAGALAVEHRYAALLAEQLQTEGWVVR